MSGLLSHRINTLLLNANRSFPSETQTAKEMINEWRRTQRCRIVRPVPDDDAWGTDADHLGPVSGPSLDDET